MNAIEQKIADWENCQKETVTIPLPKYEGLLSAFEELKRIRLARLDFAMDCLFEASFSEIKSEPLLNEGQKQAMKKSYESGWKKHVFAPEWVFKPTEEQIKSFDSTFPIPK